MTVKGYEPEELIALTAELSWKYTGCESTSITYERAQSLMEAVLYCIDAYGRWNEEALVSGRASAKDAYQKGYTLVIEKMEQLVRLVEEVLANFEDYGVLCLRDTVRHGLPEFLRRYDARFAPQETLLTLDYPLLTSVAGLSGVAAVYPYTACISYEQRFLHRFEREYVTALLRAYHRDYALLVENVCGVVLPNILGHLLLQKPLSERGFSASEYARLAAIFADKPQQEAVAVLAQAVQALVAQVYDGDEELGWYLGEGVADIAARARQGAAGGHLEAVFIL